jgi:hypothetical protein
VNDTSPEMARKYRGLLMARSGAERMKMASSMFATARALVVASVLEREPTASAATVRQALFQRFYGAEFGPAERARIAERLSRPGGVDLD